MKISIHRRLSVSVIFLIALFYLTPLFDAITGFLVLNEIFSESFIGSPSQLIRVAIIIASTTFLRRKDIYCLIGILLYFLLIEFIAFALYRQLAGVFTSFMFTYKLIFPVVVYLVLKNMIQKGILSVADIHRYMFNSGVIYALGVIIPFVLGIGFATYGEGTFGSKGFFSSGNGLGIYLGVIAALSVDQGMDRDSIYSRLKFLAIFIALILVGTKAAMILLIIVMLFVFNRLNSLVKAMLILSIGVVLYSYSDVLLEAMSTVYDVVVYRYQRSETFWEFIFSGRDDYVINAFKEYNTDGILSYRIGIGGGSFLSFRDPSFYVPAFDTLETDFFDVFFMYGVIGLSIYIFLLTYGFYKSAMKKDYGAFIIWWALSFHSLIAGHILLNGMSVIAIVIIIVTLKYDRKLKNDP